MNKKQLFQQIGARLETLRHSLNLSRNEMASHLELTENGYAKNENGKNLPGFTTMFNLAKKFDVSMDWLLFDKGPAHYKEKEETTEPAAQVETPAVKTFAAAPQKAVIKTGEGVTGNLLPETMPGDFEPGTEAPAFESVAVDVKKLLAQMAVDPQLRYEVLAYFYKYIKAHPEPL